MIRVVLVAAGASTQTSEQGTYEVAARAGDASLLTAQFG
jgi:hypothetical protein